MALLKGRKPRRTKNPVRYHGREGHPVVHEDKRGKRFMMARAKGGGTKRIYEGTKIRVGKGPRSQKVLLKLQP